MEHLAQLGIRNGRLVAPERRGLWQRHVQGIADRTIVPVVLEDGPVHDRLDALPDTAGCLGLGVPDGSQDFQYLGLRDLTHRDVADRRERVGLQALFPLICVLRVFPGGAAKVDYFGCCLGEGGNGIPMLFRQGIYPVPDLLLILLGVISRLFERNRRESPQPQPAALALDNQQLDPVLVTRRFHDKIEAVSVGVHARHFGLPDTLGSRGSEGCPFWAILEFPGGRCMAYRPLSYQKSPECTRTHRNLEGAI